MLKPLIFTILPLLATLNLKAANNARGGLCISMFTQVNSVNSDSLTEFRLDQVLVDIAFKPSIKENMTISKQKSEKHPLGGFLRILTTSDKSWYSIFRASDRDLLGSPLWFVATLGPKVAKYFGFMRVSETAMTVPDATAATATIKAVNQKLIALNEEPISLSFFETRISQPLTGRVFLNKFLRNQLPLEAYGGVAVHDISYHFASILLPRKLIVHMQAQTRLTLKFIDYLDYHLQNEDKQIIKDLISATANRIDNLGNFGHIASTIREPNWSRIEFEERITNSILYSKNPKSNIQRSFMSPKRILFEFCELHLRGYKFDNLYSSFIAEETARGNPDLNVPHLAANANAAASEIANFVLRRIDVLDSKIFRH